MTQAPLAHVGLDSMLSERDKLLSAFDVAKKQAAEDAVMTEHGVAAEAVLRDWLHTFLPKRFGVTKGHIITPNFDYQGSLEEWDLIVFDALEAPVLFVRDTKDQSATGNRRGIPVEHVRAVIEVKASLNKRSAEKMAEKLAKLAPFIGTNSAAEYPEFLCQPFASAGVFFETDVDDLLAYTAALDKLAPVYANTLNFLGALVIRSRTQTDVGAILQLLTGMAKPFPPSEELSTAFKLDNGVLAQFGSFTGWGRNAFYPFFFDLLRIMKNQYRPGFAPSFYGMGFSGPPQSKLFPDQPQ